MNYVRLTAAQALVRYLCAQSSVGDGAEKPLFAGVFAIFLHGNVAGLGEALYSVRDSLPTFRPHNEQAMGHTAIAFAKACRRRRMMVCTTSIGPGATNLVTAAALAHVNRLPVLLLPGDIFASRRPDPVLQQLESFGDPTSSVNDCLRPVSRYWDRITRPEQLITSLPQALRVLTDPAECGPVTLCLPQDVQNEACDYPQKLFEPRVHMQLRAGPDITELKAAVALLVTAERPLIIAGGGVHYSLAANALTEFADDHGIPVAETQAGKGVLAWDHPCNVGSIGVTGSSSANAMAVQADVVLAVGTRLQDFTTGSRALFQDPNWQLIQLNVCNFDAWKHSAHPLVADANRGLEELSRALSDWQAPPAWSALARSLTSDWNDTVDRVTTPSNAPLPSDAQVIGAVNRKAADSDVVVSAAGGLPGELHKLWRTPQPGGYHLEYGYSCMSYEIAGGLGVKMANPDCEIVVMVGDGSYLMMNSEIATSLLLDRKLIIVVLDNHGFGCIDRLQRACLGESYNNLFDEGMPSANLTIDFAAHAAALGATSEKVAGIAELEDALDRARQSKHTYVVVIDTDPKIETTEGGHWWDVAVPEVSERDVVAKIREAYVAARARQRVGG